jgi:starch-binding outer membrane protein, SusD/RagB family
MKKYILLIVSILALSACSDLDENPVSLIEQDKFIRTPADLQVLANGAYGLMTSERYWGRALTVTLLLRDDMCNFPITPGVPARGDMNSFIANDNNALVAGFWPQSYAIIATANEAIEGAKKFPNEKPEVINPIIAQAYFYRAFAYYNLVRLFGDIPYIDYVLRDVEQANRIFKTKEADVYNKIIADLEFAKKWLPKSTNVKAKPTKATAAAYLASLYLTRATLSFPERTMADYQEAYNQAKFVIDGEKDFGLNLEADFQNLFDSSKALTLREPLFTIDYNNFNVGGDAGQGQDYIAFLTAPINDETYTSQGGQSITVPTIKVYNSFNAKDYRRAVSFDTVYRRVFGGVPYDITKASAQVNPLPAPATLSPIPAPARLPHVAKYSRFAGKTGLNLRTSSNNYATMRYAEVLLIAAEALNELGRTDEAFPFINRVRERARNKGGRIVSFPANLSGLTKDDFRKAVIEERRIELAFEFVRWFDIKRLKLGGVNTNDGVFSDIGFEPQARFDPKKHYLLPFPQSELAINPNLAPNNPF